MLVSSLEFVALAPTCYREVRFRGECRGMRRDQFGGENSLSCRMPKPIESPTLAEALSAAAGRLVV